MDINEITPINWFKERQRIRRQARKLEQLIHDGVIDGIGTAAYHPYGESSEIVTVWSVKGTHQGIPYSFKPEDTDWRGRAEGEMPPEVHELLGTDNSTSAICIIETAERLMRRSPPQEVRVERRLQRMKRGRRASVVYIGRLSDTPAVT